jgi:hypothetical protein
MRPNAAPAALLDTEAVTFQKPTSEWARRRRHHSGGMTIGVKPGGGLAARNERERNSSIEQATKCQTVKKEIRGLTDSRFQ